MVTFDSFMGLLSWVCLQIRASKKSLEKVCFFARQIRFSGLFEGNTQSRLAVSRSTQQPTRKTKKLKLHIVPGSFSVSYNPSNGKW